MKPKVSFKNVSKKFSLYSKKTDKILELILPNKKTEDFYALRDISFEINEGETIGIVGVNGSGKSTLSNLLAQVVSPTAGSIKMNGVPSLIAISAGLNNHLTGLENIELKCLMHGLTKKEIRELTPDIIEFADIGTFINQPVKNYSSGMKSRLGFAISVHTNPDILVVDEALSVGDQTFYQKCLEKINEFKAEGKTIFFISHSLSQIESISDRVMWLHFGKVKEFGKASEVIKNYNDFINWFNKLKKTEKKAYKKEQLSDQTNGDIKGQSSVTRTRKHTIKKSGSFLLYFQSVLLITLLMVSGSFMFFDNPVKSMMHYLEDLSIFQKSHEIKEVESVKEAVEVEEVTTEEVHINEKGITQVNTSKLYKDDEMEDEVGEIALGTEVRVLKEIGNTYQVSFNNQNYYTNPENVTLDSNEEISDIQLTEDLNFAFNSSLQQSYQYFLAFLESSSEEIKGNLNGITDEYEDDFGYRYIEFGYDGVAYRLNNSGTAEAIIYSGVELNQIDLSELGSSAEVISSDESGYYFAGEQYDIIVNQEENKISLTLN